MKRNDIQELKNKSAAEMEKILKEEREKLRGLIFDLRASKAKNVSDIWKSKKTIARVMTFLNLGVKTNK